MTPVRVSRVSRLVKPLNQQFLDEAIDGVIPPMWWGKLRGRGVKMEALEKRYHLSAGDLDASFGDGGIVNHAIADRWGSADQTVEDSQGRLVVVGAGKGAQDAAAVSIGRFLANGSPDETFGDHGIAVIGDIENFTTQHIALQSDGKIIVAGAVWGEHSETTTTLGIQLWRFNTDGTLDTSFGDNGSATINFGVGHQLWGQQLLVAPDGKIMVVGNHQIFDGHNRTGMETLLARFNSDGSPDASFGDNGLVLDDWGPGEYEGASAVHILSDGKTIVGGSIGRIVDGAGDGEFVVARYNNNGTLHTTFGDDGLAMTNFGDAAGGGGVQVMTVDDQGRITAAGTVWPENFTEDSASPTVQFVRFTSDGHLDTTFGAGGIKQAEGLPMVSDMAADADGNLLLQSEAVSQEPEALLVHVARYTKDGSLDTTFGDNGIATVSWNGDVNGTVPRSLTITSDGGIVVSGHTHADGGIISPWLFKLEGGEGDSSSSSNSSSSSSSSSPISNATLKPIWEVPYLPPLQEGPPPSTVDDNTTGHWRYTDNKGNLMEMIVVNGTATISPVEPEHPGSQSALDSSFGTNVAIIDAFDQDSAQSVVIQPDGKIVVAGWSGDRADASRGGDGRANGITVIRLNTDGTLDSSFGDNGIAHFDLDPTDLSVGDPLPLVLLDDGSFLVGGRGVRKISADGHFDSSFGDNGLALVPARVELRPTDNLIQIQHQSNVTSTLTHSIIALADGTIVTLDERMDLHFFNADGSTKTSVGDNGDLNLGDNMPNGIRDSYQLALDGSGKIVVVGTLQLDYDGGRNELVLVRVNADGSLDSSFGSGGYVYAGKEQAGMQLFGRVVTVQSDGKILAAGVDDDGGTLLARFNTNGSLDDSFGDHGIARDPDDSSSSATGIAVDADGKIYVSSSYGDHLSVTRYNADGSRDTTFADNGFAAQDLFPGYQVMENGSGVAIQSDGKVIAVGHVQFYSDAAFDQADFFVVRLNTDGAGSASAPGSSSGEPSDDNSDPATGTGGPASAGPNTTNNHPDAPLFSTAQVDSSNAFDFDDPTGQKKDLTAEPEETVLPT